MLPQSRIVVDKLWPTDQSGLPLVFINKIVLNPAIPVHLNTIYDCFGTIIAIVVIQTTILKIFSVWPFIGKLCQSMPRIYQMLILPPICLTPPHFSEENKKR
jgi:hypothetical protein